MSAPCSDPPDYRAIGLHDVGQALDDSRIAAIVAGLHKPQIGRIGQRHVRRLPARPDQRAPDRLDGFAATGGLWGRCPYRFRHHGPQMRTAGSLGGQTPLATAAGGGRLARRHTSTQQGQGAHYAARPRSGPAPAWPPMPPLDAVIKPNGAFPMRTTISAPSNVWPTSGVEQGRGPRPAVEIDARQPRCCLVKNRDRMCREPELGGHGPEVPAPPERAQQAELSHARLARPERGAPDVRPRAIIPCASFR